MGNKVYFMNLRARSPRENKITKLKRLFDVAGFGELLTKNDLTAIKLHFGEAGSDGYINPVFVRQIVDKIKEKGAKPFLTDTNTLYSGSRKNAVDHMETAILHGFDYAVVGAPIIISDGLLQENAVEVKIDKNHFKTATIAGAIAEADNMIVLSHFKGHEMAGFGGAIKNLAMGCAPAKGKKEQHSTRPEVDEEKCIGCGNCERVCPDGAITMENKKAVIDKHKCIGCGECMTVCPTRAIKLNWETEIKEFTEKMTEYAYAAIVDKKDKVGYINFVINVTPDCDCVPWSDAPIVPDIGILASTDPVALDKACLDLVNQAAGNTNSFFHDHAVDCKCGEDKFKSMRQNTYGDVQISYGEEIGLGNSEYELVEI